MKNSADIMQKVTGKTDMAANMNAMKDFQKGQMKFEM